MNSLILYQLYSTIIPKNIKDWIINDHTHIVSQATVVP